jgi:hypothetical protein
VEGSECCDIVFKEEFIVQRTEGKLIPCSRVVPEKLTFVQLFKKVPASYGNQKLNIFTGVHYWSLT